MKTIKEFITEVDLQYALIIASGKWADLSPFTEDEAWTRAYCNVRQKYVEETKEDLPSIAFQLPRS